MAEKRIDIVERDKAGNVIATYVQSSTQLGDESRVDVIYPEIRKSQWQTVIDAFMPAGYPNSVTDDYLEYQIYDSLQAFSSSIAGMLSSRAVLASVGVGDSTASPTAALLWSVVQELAGRVATILFAYRFSTSLEPECKMYRLLADILNDLAFVLDCLSPAFPKGMRVLVLSFSSVLRALCGVAAGSAKASLSAHFARQGNLAELNAKDSSQETVISLFGMLAGTLVVSWVTEPLWTWTVLIALLSVHLETNRRAVKAVKMRTLNRQRATLVYHALKRGDVPTLQDVASRERIFEVDGVLRDGADKIVGHCTVGASMTTLLKSFGRQYSTTDSTKTQRDVLPKLLDAFSSKAYLLWYSKRVGAVQAHIVLKDEAAPRDTLAAWWQTLEITATQPGKDAAEDHGQILRVLEDSAAVAGDLLKQYEERLKSAGWDLDTGALETTSSLRVSLGR